MNPVNTEIYIYPPNCNANTYVDPAVIAVRRFTVQTLWAVCVCSIEVSESKNAGT